MRPDLTFRIEKWHSKCMHLKCKKKKKKIIYIYFFLHFKCIYLLCHFSILKVKSGLMKQKQTHMRSLLIYSKNSLELVLSYWDWWLLISDWHLGEFGHSLRHCWYSSETLMETRLMLLGCFSQTGESGDLEISLFSFNLIAVLKKHKCKVFSSSVSQTYSQTMLFICKSAVMV